MKRYIRCSKDSNIQQYIAELKSYYNTPLDKAAKKAVDILRGQKEDDWGVTHDMPKLLAAFEAGLDTAYDLEETLGLKAYSELGLGDTLLFVEVKIRNYYNSFYISKNTDISDMKSAAREIYHTVKNDAEKMTKQFYKDYISRHGIVTPDEFADSTGYFDGHIADESTFRVWLNKVLLPTYRRNK